MPGMYDLIMSRLGQLPSQVANTAVGVASGPLGIGPMVDQMQQSGWDAKWDQWQRDPSSFPVPGQPRPGQAPPLPPDVPLNAPPPPYGGPPVPQQLPQSGMPQMSQGMQPIGPMDQAAGGPGAPEPMGPMDMMQDYIPGAPPPAQGPAGMYGNPMMDDMMAYQKQTDSMVKQMKEANRVGMWMNMASGFLNDPGNITGGLARAGQAFAQRQQQEPGYDAFRTQRDDQYLGRLSEMAQMRKLMQPPQQSAANRKFDMGLEYGFGLLETDPQAGIEAIESVLGVDGGSSGPQYVKIGDVYGGTYDKTTQMITFPGMGPMHISDPQVKEQYAKIAASDIGLGQVDENVEAEAQWQGYAQRFNPEVADLFASRGIPPEKYAEQALQFLMEAGEIGPAEMSVAMRDPEKLGEFLSSPAVQILLERHMTQNP